MSNTTLSASDIRAWGAPPAPRLVAHTEIELSARAIHSSARTSDGPPPPHHHHHHPPPVLTSTGDDADARRQDDRPVDSASPTVGVAQSELCLVNVATATHTTRAAQGTHDEDDDDDDDDTDDDAPHPTPGRRRRGLVLRLVDRLLAVLAFWALLALVTGFFLLPTNLGVISSGGTTPLSFLWNVAPGQALLQIAALKSMADLTVGCTRPKHSASPRLRSAAVLVLAFAITVVLFVVAPTFTHERADGETVQEFNTGNCTMVSTLEQGVQEKLAAACPDFLDADGAWAHADLVAMAAEVDANATGISDEAARQTTASGIGGLASLVSRLREFAPFLAVFPLPDGVDPEWLSAECFAYAISTACAAQMPRCRYDDCQPSNAGRHCAARVQLHKWESCSRTDDSRPADGDGSVLQVLAALISGVEESGDAVLSPTEHDATLFGLRLVESEAMRNAATSSEHRQKDDDCGAHWVTSGDDDAPVAAANRSANQHALLQTSNGIRIGCDPHHRDYPVPGRGRHFDSSHVLAFFVAVLSLFVVAAAERRPTLHYANARKRNARLLSALLGLVAANFIFLAGRNFESTAVERIPSGAPATEIANLYVWAVLHYAVCWACMHKAIFIAGGSDGGGGNASAKATAKAKAKSGRRPSTSMRKIKSFAKSGNALRKGLTSSSGRYNNEFRTVQEIVENVVQLIGIESTARTSDVNAVFSRAFLLSLNLVVLPLVAMIAYRQGGPIVAKSAVILMETLFDKGE